MQHIYCNNTASFSLKKLLRNPISLLFLCFFAMSFLAGCREETMIVEDNPEDLTQDVQTYYFAVKLYDTDQGTFGTRADRFDSDYSDYPDPESDPFFNKGLEEEKALYFGYGEMAHYALIFDEGGNRKSELLELKPWQFNNPDENNTEEFTSFSTLYGGYEATSDFKNWVSKGKILVMLNVSASLKSYLDEKKDDAFVLSTYEDVMDLEVGQGISNSPDDFLYRIVGVGDDRKRFFTMSSSIVIKNGDVEPANIQTGDSIFYSSRYDAEQNPYKMYVERLQSKYTILFEHGSDRNYLDDSRTSAPSGETDYKWTENLVYDKTSTQWKPGKGKETLKYVNSYSRRESIEDDLDLTVSEGDWKVNIVGWGANAFSKSEYLFKHFTSEKLDSDDYYNNWNVSLYSNYRNFWAEGVNYTTLSFPDQYRTAYGVNGYDIAKHSLNYFSYSTLSQKKPHQYSPENTFEESIFGSNLGAAYDSKAYLRAGTHLIVAAQLLIDGFEEEGAYSDLEFDDAGLITGIKDKYYMNGIYWSETAYKEYVAEFLGYWMLTDANQAENKFGSNNGIFYIKESETSYRIANGEDFTLAEAHIPGGDGWVYLTPDEGVKLYVYDSTAEEGNQYRDITDKYAELVADHEDLMAGHFNEGRMYYPIAIRHNIKSNSRNTIATGDFGAVRNHWYYVTVNSIISPGLPVDVPEQPIVPNNEPEETGLGVNISILEWHKVQTDTDLKDQVRPGQGEKNQEGGNGDQD